MANYTDSVSVLEFFNLGNGVIEVAALTSLMGSAAAQSLALGDKGPSASVCARMNTFGTTSIVTVLAAPAMPGWLRESVGVRSAKLDSVVGLSLNLDKGYKYRDSYDAVNWVECEFQNVIAKASARHYVYWP